MVVAGMRKRESLLREILEQELNKAKQKNPRYSLRALAKNLRVSPATLSRILSGKSNLSKKIALQIAEKLNLDRDTKLRITEFDQDPFAGLPDEGEFADLVQTWYLSPLVCLVETKDFREDYVWIAARLGITPVEAKEAIEKLLEIGFLQRDESGRLSATDIAVATTTRREGLDPSQIDKVERLKENLQQLDPDLRELSDIGNIVVATSPRKIAEVKRRTRTFRRNLAKFLDGGEKTEVYVIFTQVIPLTKLKGFTDKA
jgi:transcriptional regulator with XRE-family HTH domain